MAAEELYREQPKRPDVSHTVFREYGDVDGFHLALVRKRALMEAGDPAHEEIQLGLRLAGGGLLGALTAGYLKQLYREGYGPCITRIDGWSTGAAAGYIALGATHPEATEAYHQDVAPNKLVDGNPLAFACRRVVRIDGLSSMYARYVDDDRVRRSNTQLYVGVTDRNGDAQLVHLQVQDDMRSLVLASGAPPGISTHHLVSAAINGTKSGFYDGGIAQPDPYPHPEEDRTRITHTLVLKPTIEGGHIGRLPLEFLALDPRYRGDPAVRASIRSLDERKQDSQRRFLAYVQGEGNVGVIAPAFLPPGASEFAAKPHVLRAIQMDMESNAAEHFRQARVAYQARQLSA